MEETKNKSPKYAAAYFFGILLLLLGLLVIFWNGNRAKGRADRDDQIISNAVEIDPLNLDSLNEGKYVIIYGSLQTDQVFHDKYFDITYPGIAYTRRANNSSENSESEYDYGYWTYYGGNYSDESTTSDAINTAFYRNPINT